MFKDRETMNNNIFNSKGEALKIKAFHPGIFLEEEIEEREMLKKELAHELGILPTNLSEILRGKRNISPRLAVKLEKTLKISAEYWLNLQTAWDLQNAREEEYA